LMTRAIAVAPQTISGTSSSGMFMIVLCDDSGQMRPNAIRQNSPPHETSSEILRFAAAYSATHD
jgi:hypothetical protein